MKDLCTPSEIKALNERWEVAQLLYKKDKSYRQIAFELKTSTATVTRVARFLFSESNKGYQNALKRIK
jgi:TrpR-related protein YerC/YecD